MDDFEGRRDGLMLGRLLQLQNRAHYYMYELWTAHSPPPTSTRDAHTLRRLFFAGTTSDISVSWPKDANFVYTCKYTEH